MGAQERYEARGGSPRGRAESSPAFPPRSFDLLLGKQGVAVSESPREDGPPDLFEQLSLPVASQTRTQKKPSGRRYRWCRVTPITKVGRRRANGPPRGSQEGKSREQQSPYAG